MGSQRSRLRRPVWSGVLGVSIAAALLPASAGDEPPAERADWVADGEQDGSLFGWDVSIGGDVNGDGYADAAVGAPLFDSQEVDGVPDVGAVYVYHGSSAGLGLNPARRLDGYAFDPEALGRAVALGDVNGDGYADLVAGRPYASVKGFEEGAVSIYRGSPEGVDGFPSTDLYSFSTGAWFGESVATLDANGDRIADVLVGSPLHTSRIEGAGAAYLYLGSTDGVSANEFWSYFGAETGAQLGFDVNGAGDVNGDGVDDILVGAYLAGVDDRGLAMLFLGSRSGIATEPDWVFAGGQPGEELGVSVSSAGDVDADGYDDVVIGAWNFDGRVGQDCGRVLWFRGGPDGLEPAGTTLAEGETVGAAFGRCVAAVGDVNGDGYDDVAVGAPTHTGPLGAAAGRVYVFPGGPAGLAGAPLWVLDATAPTSVLGASVAGRGDVNGDGYPDVISGAILASSLGAQTGRAELVHGGLPLVSGFGVALDMVTESADAPPFFVTITYTLANLGNGPLTALDLANDLSEVFGAGRYEVLGPPRLLTDSPILVNGGFDGGASTSITSPPASALFAGELARIAVDVEVFESGRFTNQVVATCQDGDGVLLSDASTRGILPDPDGDGDADEAEPTTISLGASTTSRTVPDMPLASWHLWSVPLEVAASDPMDPPRLEPTLRRVFDRPSDIRTWLAYAQMDSLIEDPILAAGQAYWVNSRYPVTPSRVSGIERPAAELELVPGWNAVGCPSGEAAAFSTMRLRRVRVPSEALTLGQARDLGLIDGFFRHYEDDSPDLLNNGVWRSESVSSVTPGAAIEPWGGRLLRVFGDPLVLSFGRSASDTLDARPAAPAWSLTITARSGGHRSSVVLSGVDGASARWDVFDVAAPPSWSDALGLSVAPTDWGVHAGPFERSAVDPSLTTPAKFPLALESAARATLSLAVDGVDGIDAVDAGLQVHLLLESGVGIDLGRRPVAFEAGTHRVTIRVARTAWPGPTATSIRGGVTAVAPTVSWGPFHVRYELTWPTDAAQMIVYDVRGRKVHDTSLPSAIGTHEWTWDSRDASGRKVGPGRYILEFRAGGVRERRSVTVLG